MQQNSDIHEAARHIIAGDQRLSCSMIWEIQRQYFLRSGMRAWQDDVVPHYISSNPVMARAYSQVVLGYLRDCFAAATDADFQCDRSQPFYIVELGAGSGRLAHHFLHQFHTLLARSPFADLSFKYVLTDFVPQILDFWQKHARFKPWVEAGLLDFALFDVMAQRPLTLTTTNQTLTPDQLTNPLILIANYFFDSIPQDSFVLEDSQVHANLLSIYSTQPEPDLADPTIWDRLELAYEAFPLETPYANEPIYNQILDSYAAQFPDTTLSFPNVGLDCLRFWQGYGSGNLLLLTSDRGHTMPEALLDQDDPLPNLHGSFSLMVNYHAIGEYVEINNGLALYPPHYQDNLQVAAYLLGQIPQAGLETGFGFETAVIQNGPDDFFAIKTALEPHLPTMTLPQILSYLRLSAWDAAIFCECYPTLLAQLKQASPAWYPDVQAVLNRIWQQYLPLQAEDDLAAKIQVLLTEMDLADDYNEYFDRLSTVLGSSEFVSFPIRCSLP